jgi:hypothetical protein
MRVLFTALILVITASAADFAPPEGAVAGAGVTIPTSGSGEENLFVFGPGTAIKRDVKLGSPIELTGDDIARAGRYMVILGGTAKSFHVKPAQPKKLSFIARPSRVPVAKEDAVIGVTFVFDNHGNLVLAPTPVKFALSVNGNTAFSRTVTSRNGVAWIRTASSNREGAAQFIASLAGTQVRRVVQQVAADACTIRMKAHRQGSLVELVTEPVRDCSGNTLPDGTIVTFGQTAPGGLRSTVDARIKRGIARAKLPAISGSTLSVASGVTLGNEIRLTGGD